MSDPKAITTTEFRKNLFQYFKQVQAGKPVQINYKNKINLLVNQSDLELPQSNIFQSMGKPKNLFQTAMTKLMQTISDDQFFTNGQNAIAVIIRNSFPPTLDAQWSVSAELLGSLYALILRAENKPLIVDNFIALTNHPKYHHYDQLIQYAQSIHIVENKLYDRIYHYNLEKLITTLNLLMPDPTTQTNYILKFQITLTE